MTTPPVPEKPVVEQAPGISRSEDLTERSLRLRIRQQEILAELGVLALQGTKFIDLLNPSYSPRYREFGGVKEFPTPVATSRSAARSAHLDFIFSG
jgi:hypothetical protein